MADGSLFPGFWRNISQIEIIEQEKDIDVCGRMETGQLNKGGNLEIPSAWNLNIPETKRVGSPINEMKRTNKGNVIETKNQATSNIKESASPINEMKKIALKFREPKRLKSKPILLQGGGAIEELLLESKR